MRANIRSSLPTLLLAALAVTLTTGATMQGADNPPNPTLAPEVAILDQTVDVTTEYVEFNIMVVIDDNGNVGFACIGAEHGADDAGNADGGMGGNLLTSRSVQPNGWHHAGKTVSNLLAEKSGQRHANAQADNYLNGADARQRI